MRRHGFFFGCLLLWLTCLHGLRATLADVAKPPRAAATIPFTLGADGRMYVQGMINHQVQATFLVDTGCDVNYLSAAIQDKLRLPLRQVTTEVNGKDTGKPAFLEGKALQAVLPSLVAVGGLNITDTPFILQRTGQLPEAPLPTKHVDGVIGSRTMENFALLIDFGRKSMTIWYPAGLTRQERDALNLNVLYTVPITPSPSNPDIWLAHVRLSGEKIAAEQDLMIDTGAAITTIPNRTAKQLDLVDSGGGTATLFLNKKVLVSSSQVTKMQIGDFVLLGHAVYYPNEENPAYPVSFGMDIFRGYIPLIDFGQKTMYLGNFGTAAVNVAPKK